MIDQLIANIKKTNAPIVVGLDPMMKFIPELRRSSSGRMKIKFWMNTRKPACGSIATPII